jgi:hypothetical protein
MILLKKEKYSGMALFSDCNVVIAKISLVWYSLIFDTSTYFRWKSNFPRNCQLFLP